MYVDCEYHQLASIYLSWKNSNLFQVFLALELPKATIPRPQSIAMRFSKSVFLSLGVLALQASAFPMPEPRAIIRAITIMETNTTTTTTTTTIVGDPTIPSTNTGTDLPSPASTLALKYVALGRGTQNYSCTAPSAVPTAVGAAAVLFDITDLARANSSVMKNLTTEAVYIPFDPLTSTEFSIPGIYWLGYLGHHFFNAASVPTFDLSAVGDILYGNKTASVAAPSDASEGPDDTGAIPWLQLQDKAGSVGLKEVYRVETAGGNAYATCAAAGIQTVDYAAQYWFYD